MKAVIVITDFICLCLLFFALQLSGLSLGVLQFKANNWLILAIALLLMPYPFARRANPRTASILSLANLALCAAFSHYAFDHESGAGPGAGIFFLFFVSAPLTIISVVTSMISIRAASKIAK